MEYNFANIRNKVLRCLQTTIIQHKTQILARIGKLHWILMKKYSCVGTSTWLQFKMINLIMKNKLLSAFSFRSRNSQSSTKTAVVKSLE